MKSSIASTRNRAQNGNRGYPGCTMDEGSRGTGAATPKLGGGGEYPGKKNCQEELSRRTVKENGQAGRVSFSTAAENALLPLVTPYLRPSGSCT